MLNWLRALYSFLLVNVQQCAALWIIRFDGVVLCGHSRGRPLSSTMRLRLIAINSKFIVYFFVQINND